jgi:microcystin-dependent protein
MAYTTPRTWVAGEYPTAAQFNQDVRDNVAYVAAGVTPTGAVLPYAGAAAPTGWLICDGTAKSRAVYAELYAVVGTTYGAGDGTTTFNIPDLRQRVPLGKAASGTGSTLGGTGGSKDAVAVSHNHTQDAHDHTQDAHSHPFTTGSNGSHEHDTPNQYVVTSLTGGHNATGDGDPDKTQAVTFTDLTASAGSHTHTGTSDNATANNQVGTATNQASGVSGTDANLPPYVALNYLIKT